MEGQEVNFISTILENYGGTIAIVAIVIAIIVIRSTRDSYGDNGGLNAGFKIAILTLIASGVFFFLQTVAFPSLFVLLARISLIIAGLSFLVGIASGLFKK